MDHNTASPVYLSVMLALDGLGEQALHHSSSLLASASRVRCLRILADQQGFHLAALDISATLPEDRSETAQALDSKASACQRAIASAGQLRAGISTALHELRAHRNLLHSSNSSPGPIYLDIYLLGDLSQPRTAGLLAPVLLIAAELLADEPDGMLHLLLGTAIFPAEQSPQLRAGLFVSLNELGGMLESLPPWQNMERNLSQQLLQEPGAASSLYQSGRLSVYLFDLRKEGALEVSDREELALLAANALGALHSAGLAQRLAGEAAAARLSAVHGAPNGPFSALGVSVLGCDFERLMQSCTTRLAIDFLEHVLAASPLDATNYPQDLGRRILDRLGHLEDALDELCSDTPFAVQRRESGLGQGFAGLEWSRPNFPVLAPRLQGVAPSDWAGVLQAERQRLESEQIPLWMNSLQMRAARLDNAWQAVLQQALQDLPQLALGEGASLPGCRSVLQNLEVEFRTWLQRLAINNVEEEVRLQTDRLSLALQDLQRLASAHLPRRTLRSLWQSVRAVLRQPGNTPGLIAALGEALLQWWLQHDTHLQAQRKQVEILLAAWAAAVARCAAMQALHRLVENRLAQVAQAYEHLDRLEMIAGEALNRIESLWEAGEPHQSPLRRELATLQAARWCVQRWQPEPASLRLALLHQFSLLGGWPEITADDLTSRLARYGRMLFAGPLGSLPLSQLLKALPESHSSHKEISGLLMQAVLPLRPRFDSLGGAALANEAGWLLLPPDLVEDWQVELAALSWPWHPLSAPGIHAVFCCRARLNLPLAALAELIRNGHKALALLEPKELADLFLLADLLPQGGGDPLSWVFLPPRKSNGRCSPGMAQS